VETQTGRVKNLERKLEDAWEQEEGGGHDQKQEETHPLKRREKWNDACRREPGLPGARNVSRKENRLWEKKRKGVRTGDGGLSKESPIMSFLEKMGLFNERGKTEEKELGRRCYNGRCLQGELLQQKKRGVCIEREKGRRYTTDSEGKTWEEVADEQKPGEEY